MTGNENALAATRAQNQEQNQVHASSILPPASYEHPRGVDRLEAPEILRELRGWLIWRYEEDAVGGKPRKVPYYVDGGRRHGVQGSSEDRAKLTTFTAALEATRRKDFDGVGIALMPEFGIVALDFDNCVGSDGLAPEVERLVMGTYAEYSPSGRGVRAFFRGDLGNRKSAGEPFGFETFSSKGFVTVTGDVLPVCEVLGNENTVAEVTPEVRALCAHRFDTGSLADGIAAQGVRVGLTEAQLAEALDVLDPDMPHDDWLHVGMALHHETEGEGFEKWNTWSSRGSKYPGDEVLLKRWESFGQPGRRPVTARTLVKMANEHGARLFPGVASVEEFDALAEEPAVIGAHVRKFTLLPAHEFAQGKPPGWIVKGLLPQAGLAVIYGESGCGKSFFVLDVGAAVARGIDWRGQRVKQGRVVYVAAEGAGGFKKRLTAYGRHHGIDLKDVHIEVLKDNLSLLGSDYRLLARAVQDSGGAAVIVVDTLAQTTPGANENGAEDMGRALGNCKRLHEATGALIVLIHHSGKDATRGARGWSGIRAAVDAEIEITNLAGSRVARVTKQKDGEDGRAFPFRLQVVPIGMDEDGEVIDSCVVEHIDDMPVTPREPSGAVQKLVWGLAQVMADVDGIVDYEALIQSAISSTERKEGTQDKRRRDAIRAINALHERAYFNVLEGKVVLSQIPKPSQI